MSNFKILINLYTLKLNIFPILEKIFLNKKSKMKVFNILIKFHNPNIINL